MELPKNITLQPFQLERKRLITDDEADRIDRLAGDILEKTGIEVHDADLLSRLTAAGFRVSGNRVLISPEVRKEYLDWMRSQSKPRRRVQPAPLTSEIRLYVSSYSLFVHDYETDKVISYSREKLIDMTKLVDSLAGDGVLGSPPGIPMDAHPDMQPIDQYRIAALYSRQGATPVDPTSPKTVNYLLDMAEVMGQPMRSLPVYIPTPLRLGGESLDVVLSCLDRIDSITVASMPSAGTSAPLQPFGALALSAAETMGGAILVRQLTGKPVFFGVSLFPSDLRQGTMVFGSPENMLYYMLARDFGQFYGFQGSPAPNNIHVMAKVPDGQSAAEKAAIMAYGAALGERDFFCAGTLSLDEIFSPEQLLLDCEIRNWVQQSIKGVWLGEEEEKDWQAAIESGLSQGFINHDSTLNHYRDHVWYPGRFQRGAIGPWMSAGQPKLSKKLRAEIRERIHNHSYQLEGRQRTEIENIYRSAEKAILRA